MTRARWMWVVVFVAAVGCGGTDADPQQAAPNGVTPDHETLGIWPNVVVAVNAQMTAADLLFEIMKEAEGGGITPAQLQELVIAVARCGRNQQGNPPPPPKIDEHAAMLAAALAKAKAGNWGTANPKAGCIGDLGHATG